MRLTIDREQLLEAIRTVSNFAEGNGVLEAAPEGGVYSLSAGGSEGGAKYTLSSLDDFGTIVIPLGRFFEWANESRSPSIYLKASEHGVTAQGLPSERYSFEKFESDAVPTLTPPEEAATVTLEASDFRQLVNRTAFAGTRPSAEMKRWVSGAACFDLANGRVTLRCTDTDGLATATAQGVGTGFANRALLPLATVRKWASIADSPVTLRIWDNGATFTCGPVEAWTPLLVGTFPTLHDARYEHSAKLPTVEFLRCVRMALAGSEEEVNPKIKYVTIHLDGMSVTVCGESTDGGLSSSVSLTLAERVKPAVSICLDGAYLAAYLRTVQTEESVVLKWNDGSRPVEFFAGENSQYLTTVRTERKER